MIGTTVGSYKILSKLSVGGMGTVYRAEHVLIGKHAAVKVLHPELSTDRDIVNRFFNEAKATTSIKHPGIVEIFDFGYMPSGHAFLIMEFLEGMSLARRCKTGGRMGEGDASMLLRGVCSALSAAHAKGIVHRDLKPDNIFLVPDPDSAIGERPKVLDFGIAKLTEIGAAGNATKTGAVMGTPTYMSPEQCRGTGDVDHRADLYSIGCIYYELLTGQPPFTKLGAGELIGAHLYVEPPKPSALLPSISEASEKLIMALLAKNPDHRPQSARELGARFQDIAAQQGWITHSTPSGITATSMPLLTPPPPPATIHDSGFNHTTAGIDGALPSMPPGATTPYRLTPPPLFTPRSTPSPSAGNLLSSTTSRAVDGEAGAEKPTTLSGAASQSFVDAHGRIAPRRSRNGLRIAMAAAALIAGGTVGFLQLRGARSSETVPATSPASPVGTPVSSPTGPDTKPTTPPVADTTTPPITDTKPAPDTKPVDETKPAVEDPKPVVAIEPEPTKTTEPKLTRKQSKKDARPKLKPVPADAKMPDPTKPKPDPNKPLFETDI